LAEGLSIYTRATKMPEPSDTVPHEVLVETARKTRELYEYVFMAFFLNFLYVFDFFAAALAQRISFSGSLSTDQVFVVRGTPSITL
jgi:hypothetical protein